MAWSRLKVPSGLWRSACLAISLTAVAAPSSDGAAAVDPFAPLAGQWDGSGTVTFANSASDRIRCRAENVVEANVLRHKLLCASASYRFEMSAEMRHAQGQLSGTWMETTQNVTGTISGWLANANLRAFVHGAGYFASVDVNTVGDRQTMRIRPQGEDVTEVSIQLQRTAR
jgi:hypothetical protein